MEYQAFTLLCGLAALAFAASGSSGKQSRAWLAWPPAFLAASLLCSPAPFALLDAPLLAVMPSQLAMLTVIGAALHLCRPGWAWLSQALSGWLTAAWAGLLTAQGMPGAAAFALALLLAGLALWRSQGPHFAPPALVDEAMTGLLAGGLALVVLPEALEGWRSGHRLQALDAGASELPALGALVVVAAALSLGMLRVIYLHWKRK